MLRQAGSRSSCQTLAAMKRIALAIVLSLVAFCAHAATITKSDLVGTWATGKPNSILASINSWFHDVPIEQLEVGRDFSVRYTRHFESGQQQVLVAPPSAVTFADDLLIVRFKGPFGYPTKLVLSGWSTSASKRLFGTYILYGEEGLFNGINVAFAPANGS